jgi:hypothetical protein
MIIAKMIIITDNRFIISHFENGKVGLAMLECHGNFNVKHIVVFEINIPVLDGW